MFCPNYLKPATKLVISHHIGKAQSLFYLDDRNGTKTTAHNSPLLAGIFRLKAQDIPVSVLDGPVLKIDTLSKGLFSVLKLFLTSPYKFQDGYVPVMSASNPFMAIKTPGGAPYENPYSPDKFPQAVRMEYDTATGTYKPVMVDWKEYQKQLDVRYNIPIENRPIPKVPLAPGDRLVP